MEGSGPSGMRPGVLRPAVAAAHFRLLQQAPAPPLDRFVDFHWIVRWDLTGRAPHEQQVLPHPAVHLVFEDGGPRIYGVDRSLFVRRLEGRGQVLGVKFRPGGFRPFLGGPVSRLTDRVVAAGDLLGPAVVRAQEAVLAAEDPAEMAARAEAALRESLPPPDPDVDRAAALVARIADDPGLRRVGDLAAATGMSARQLQRLFADHVGVGPKWVMRRARLHEAAARADLGRVPDWARLAADLGYADQAHLTRDFTATLGIPPARYALAR